MNSPIATRPELERIIPLVRSIAREHGERTRAAAALEERLQRFGPTAKAHTDEVNRIQAELAIHRRELRRCRKELERLGCSVDESNPLHILCPSLPGGADYALKLDDTRFWHAPVNSVV